MCWIFYCVNDDAKIDFENTQIMHCILCYQKPIIRINSRTQGKKRLIFQYKISGIISLKKHVDVEHIVIAKMFEKEINFLLKRRKEKQPTKKRAIVFGGSKFKIFLIKNSFKEKDVPLKEFLKDLGLLIVKNYLPIQLVESMWPKHLILCLCPKLHFPSKRQFS